MAKPLPSACLLLPCLALLAAPAQAAGPDPAGPSSFLFLPGEDRGDAAASLDALLERLRADVNSPALALGLGRLARFAPLVPDGDARAAALVTELLASPRLVNGWNREMLRAQVIEQLRAKGALEDADVLQSAGGSVRRWLAIGAFGAARRAGFDVRYSPEDDALGEDLDLSRVHRNRRRELRWKPLRPTRFETQVNLLDVVNGSGISYAVAHVHLKEAASGWAVYEGGSARLWLNRSELGRVDREGHRLPRALRFPVRLRAGWNRILIKVHAGLGFRLRLADERGESLDFTEEVAARSRPVSLAATAPTAPRRTANHEAFEAAAGWSLGNRLAFGIYVMSLQGLSEEGLTEVEAVLAKPQAAETPWVVYLAGIALENADHLRRTQRVPRSRAAFEKCLALTGDRFVPAERKLAQLDFAASKEVEAVMRLERCLEANPEDLETALMVHRLFQRVGWEGESDALRARLFQRHGRLSTLLSLEASALDKLGRADDALALYKELYERDQRRSWYLRLLRERAIEAGDRAAALAALERQRLRDPESARWVHGVKARIFAATGDRDHQLAALRALVREAPDNLDTRENLGKQLMSSAQASRAEEGRAMLQDVLAREPERHELRRLLRLGAEKQAPGFWEEWSRPASAILATKDQTRNFPQASTVCLWDQTVTKIYADGSYEEVVTQAWRILDARGVQSMGQRSELGETLRIQTVTAEGRVLEPIRTSGGGFEMPGLAPGAVVIHSFRSSRGAPGLQFSYGPWWLQDPDQSEPFVASQWVLIADDAFKFEVLARNLPAPPRVLKRPGQTIRIFESALLDRVEPEPFMPPREEYLPHISLYEPISLAELTPLYEDRFLSIESAVTPSIRAKVKEITAGKSTDAQRAHALYRFIKDKVNERGYGGSAAEILAGLEGDAMTLYRAFLRAADIPFDDALAGSNPRLGDATDWGRPRPGQFANPLLRLRPRDGEPIWLDPSNPRYAAFGALSESLWGAPTLILGGSRGLTSLPSQALEGRGTRSRTTIALNKDGAATIRQTLTALDHTDTRLKEGFDQIDERQRRSFLQRQANERFPGSRLTGYDLPDLKDPRKPLVLQLDIAAENVARKRGDGRWVVPGLVAPSTLRRFFGGRPERRFDYVIDLWLSRVDRVELDPGPAFKLGPLPKDVMIKESWGSFSLVFVRAKEKVMIERRILLPPGRIPASQHRRFMTFVEAVDSAELVDLVLESR